MKVAVAAGHARRFVVGDPDIQLIDVLAGALMDRLAAAEHHAERGEVVLDAATLESPDRPGGAGSGPRPGARSGRCRRRPGGPGAPAAPAAGHTPAAEVGGPPVAAAPRLRTDAAPAGASSCPSCARRSPCSSASAGIDYDNDPDAHLLLDHFIRRAQRVIDGYGGNLLQLTIGDKGAYLHAVFGAPLAHEDDAARACAAAIDVLALEAGTAVAGLQVGLSQGRLRSGAYGHRHRRAFSCLGDAVNLAARLMSAAPAGQVYVTAAVARDAGGSFTFEELADLSVKGKAAPVAARRLTGRSRGAQYRTAPCGAPPRGPGRRAGARCSSWPNEPGPATARSSASRPRPAWASRDWSKRSCAGSGNGACTTYAGAAASVGSATSYLAWQGIWAALLGVAAEGDPTRPSSAPVAAVDTGLLAEAAPARRRPGHGHRRQRPDPRLRRQVAQDVARVAAAALPVTCGPSNEPLVLLLEDCHWMDPLSVDLLEVLARAVATLPVLVLLTYRPGSFAAPGLAAHDGRRARPARPGQLPGAGGGPPGRAVRPGDAAARAAAAALDRPGRRQPLLPGGAGQLPARRGGRPVRRLRRRRRSSCRRAWPPWFCPASTPWPRRPAAR